MGSHSISDDWLPSHSCHIRGKTTFLWIRLYQPSRETGAERLNGLETGRFVGTSQSILEEGQPPVIEMEISKIVKGRES